MKLHTHETIILHSHFSFSQPLAITSLPFVSVDLPLLGFHINGIIHCSLLVSGFFH